MFPKGCRQRNFRLSMRLIIQPLLHSAKGSGAVYEGGKMYNRINLSFPPHGVVIWLPLQGLYVLYPEWQEGRKGLYERREAAALYLLHSN